MTLPTAVIGDVHGRSDKLEKLLGSSIVDGRRLIFVGDYINRGPDSRGVIERLISARGSEGNAEAFHFLRGNHEELLLAWLLEGRRDPFIRIGGLATVRSYSIDRSPGALDRFATDFPSSHLDFLRRTAIYYEESGFLVSHAGFDPTNPTVRDLPAMVFGKRSGVLTASSAMTAFSTGKLVIFGHYVQECNAPRVEHPLYCIDTGCGTLPDGMLTALLLPELRIVQF